MKYPPPIAPPIRRRRRWLLGLRWKLAVSELPPPPAVTSGSLVLMMLVALVGMIVSRHLEAGRRLGA